MGGVLLINKPRGITSTGVVEKVREKLGEKVGHTGTLDPIAQGLLVLLVGTSTRFSPLFLNMDKSYEVVARLGVETDTYDAEGKVLRECEVKTTCEEVEKVLGEFVGEIEQTPPKFSAKRVKGRRAYELARRGIDFELKKVKVKVYRASLLDCSLPRVKFFFEVSSGTYVRSLINDIGKRVSCGAIVEELQRVKVGPFSLEEAINLQDFLKSDKPKEYLIPVEEALNFLPKYELSGQSKKLLKGGSVTLRRKINSRFVRLFYNERFVGIGELRGKELKPYRLLPN